MDLDPFEPVGIGAPTMRFLDLFLLHCLLADSPPDTPAEIKALARNQQRVAGRGREPGLQLERAGTEVALADWGAQVLQQLEPIAARLDALHGGAGYRDALVQAQATMRSGDTAPSARVLAVMARDFDSSYVAFTRAQSEQTRNKLLALPFTSDMQARFVALSKASVEDRKRIEAHDSLPFEQYRLQYLSEERLGVPPKAALAR